MAASEEVALVPATPADAVLLANLLELYIHDLSEIFAISPGPDGRFGYDKLPLYWSEPQRRSPYLIRCGARVVGFILATRGSPVTDDPADFDIAEFFVLRRERRSGVGRLAARLLWDRHPGHWIVRVSQGNRPALPFWESVIREYTAGAFMTIEPAGAPHGWRIFSFDVS